MFRRYRQRRGPYAMARPSPAPSFIRSIILLIIALVVLYFIGKGILHLFGFGGPAEARTAVAFATEGNGTVNVSLDGGLMQRADTNLKLYPGDKLSSLGDGNARLTFFDGSMIRTDNNTDLTIDQSETSTASSDWQMTLGKGAVWVNTPSAASSSGTVTRTIVTPRFTASVPASTQAEIEPSGLLVYNAEGNGIAVTLQNAKQPIFIGEGQQLNLPTTVSGDPLQYRSAIDPLAAEKPFVRESRAIATGQTAAAGSGQTAIDPTAITVLQPVDHAALTGGTVEVSGTVGAKVDSVRVNGYAANIDKTQGTFSQELAMNDSSQMNISIQALDSNGVVLDEVTRTVLKASSSLPSPTITSPANNGQTYRTQATQLNITGKAPSNAAGIMVNDYKLQLFRLGDTTWSYLASNALNNLHAGTNVFNVYTIGSDGSQSAPATITILQEAGTVGVVATASSGSTASAPAQIDETTLPQNAPLTPGVITVTGPQAGDKFVDNGSGDILIEGTTSKGTDSIWVNGYKLQLYKPGKTTWNYIAKTDFGTLKAGPNKYVINARDKDGKILDTFTYTVIYNP
ncbi:MAG TPA: hypothetical protein VHA78_05420 [Candidatus Peribacteraceae bacterium]|nr:hypothetical protein [Candidatus Peribacteraceae bacterium]